METDQTLINQDDKKWDRPWTTDEIRKNSGNWTLAGDVGLYNLLNEISQNIISRTHEVENAVDSLVYRTKMANAKICNIINDFHMLSNLQFVENRVYDEEIQETVPEPKPVEKTKEQKEAEMLPKIKKAVELGLEVLDKAFTKIHVDEISDSEDEDISSDGRTILEPKDPYASRPLPFIIGSEEFNNNDYAGLQDLLEEDVEYSVEVESSISESEETTTDEEEPLPLDEDKFTGMPSQRMRPQSESDKYSSSEESDLFGSEKAENGFISDSSFDNKAKTTKSTEELNEEAKVERKESKSFQPTNLPQVLPVPKMQEKKKVSEDLFATDEPSDDESPFRKKTGLFTSGLKFDDDEKDMFSDDLFGEKPKETKKVSESPKPSPTTKINTTVQKDKEEPVLFGNDEDSDDDIFNTLMKTKTPSTVKESKTNKQSPSDKADSSSTPSSAPSTKPSGNAFDFMGGGGNSDSLFGDESDADDLFTTKKSSAKKFDFEASQDDDDDLFGLSGGKASKKIEAAESKKLEETKPSLFEESDEIDKPYKKMGTPLPGLVPSKPKETKPEEISKPQSSYKKIGQPLPGLVPRKSDSLFEDKDSSSQKSSPAISTKKVKDSIFDDSDSSGQEDKPLVVPVKQSIPKKKEISLFDDEPDDDDIFSQVPKKLMSPGESPSLMNKSGKSQFSKLHSEDKPEKKEKAPSLFEDDEDIFKQEIKSKPAPAVSKTKDLSLFEDSDNFDLFSPKTEVQKRTEPVSVKESLKDDLFKSSDETDSSAKPKSIPQPVKDNIFADVLSSDEGISATKPEVKSVPLSAETVASEGSFFGFDAPPDSTKTLHVISKDRARVNTKRRRPTKKGRIAALEQSEKEMTPEASSPPSTSASSAPDEDLFSDVQNPPTPATQSPSTYKAQEKKKMNLMSQLMSEAAATKIGKKVAAPVVEEDEDDIDIFAEALNKDRTKSRGFSFNSPIESVPAPAAKSEEKKEERKSSVDILNSEDADNDDFFTEPSFKNFRSSISHKNSILGDDDDEDDLFSTVKTSPLQKAKESTEPDIFADDTDIFADIAKEKYEMFPSNVYDDDGDDIFSITDPLSSDKTISSSSKPSSTAVKKEAEKKPVDLFDDPLSGLLGDD
ncbi:WASH complex subunit 2-like isoform X2 [Argiope bruennichi]|uniref:WASH complex subunit 2-like isoform X2 n=1 Tax=Argiope bruennichi TaxID=94029 RepID=UPI002494281A|nr:WASH complex subunit 2-like isoform X2 [Argiope bruennichi]